MHASVGLALTRLLLVCLASGGKKSLFEKKVKNKRNCTN